MVPNELTCHSVCPLSGFVEVVCNADEFMKASKLLYLLLLLLLLVLVLVLVLVLLMVHMLSKYWS